MIYAARRLIRSIGWLLTPLAAWAASFLGGWLGGRVGSTYLSPQGALLAMIGGAVLGGLLGAALWVWGLRRALLSAVRHQRDRLMRDREARRSGTVTRPGRVSKANDTKTPPKSVPPPAKGG